MIYFYTGKQVAGMLHLNSILVIQLTNHLTDDIIKCFYWQVLKPLSTEFLLRIQIQDCTFHYLIQIMLC